jgi:hypothetical protein
MHSPTLTLSVRNALMLALGLTASTVAVAGGCADRESHELCANSEVDYATCMVPPYTPDPDDPDVRVEVVCFDGSNGCDPCDAEAITGAAIERADLACQVLDIHHVTLACGPDPEATDCCYQVHLEGDLSCAVEGRPLRVGTERAPRVAAQRTGTAWLADAQAFAGLCRPQDGAMIERLRDRWLTSAAHEHASVAAFARVGLQLLSLGAPAELLRATQQAMADEVRHAQLCYGLAAAYGFGLAAAYAGAPPCEAGPLRIEGCLSTGMALESALREAILEGALGEGAAAIEALEGARACVDPVVRGVLSRIAEDEQRHALLAYRTVQWALDREPRRARELVCECLRDGQLHAPKPAAERGGDDDDAVRGYGLLSSNRRAWLRYEVWHELVAPILAAMLQAPSTHAGATCRART